MSKSTKSSKRTKMSKSTKSSKCTKMSKSTKSFKCTDRGTEADRGHFTFFTLGRH